MNDDDKKKKNLEFIENFARKVPWIVVIVSIVATIIIILQMMFQGSARPF